MRKVGCEKRFERVLLFTVAINFPRMSAAVNSNEKSRFMAADKAAHGGAEYGPHRDREARRFFRCVVCSVRTVARFTERGVSLWGLYSAPPYAGRLRQL